MPGSWGAPATGLRGEIERHMIRFRDWPAEDLLERLGAFGVTHPRFGYLLEGLASPAVLPDEQAQRRRAELANGHQLPVGAQLHRDGEEDAIPPAGSRSRRTGATWFARSARRDGCGASTEASCCEIPAAGVRAQVLRRRRGVRWR